MPDAGRDTRRSGPPAQDADPAEPPRAEESREVAERAANRRRIEDLHGEARRQRERARELGRAMEAVASSGRGTADRTDPHTGEAWAWDGWSLARMRSERDRAEIESERLTREALRPPAAGDSRGTADAPTPDGDPASAAGLAWRIGGEARDPEAKVWREAFDPADAPLVEDAKVGRAVEALLELGGQIFRRRPAPAPQPVPRPTQGPDGEAPPPSNPPAPPAGGMPGTGSAPSIRRTIAREVGSTILSNPIHEPEGWIETFPADPPRPEPYVHTPPDTRVFDFVLPGRPEDVGKPLTVLRPGDEGFGDLYVLALAQILLSEIPHLQEAEQPGGSGGRLGNQDTRTQNHMIGVACAEFLRLNLPEMIADIELLDKGRTDSARNTETFFPRAVDDSDVGGSTAKGGSYPDILIKIGPWILVIQTVDVLADKKSLTRREKEALERLKRNVLKVRKFARFRTMPKRPDLDIRGKSDADELREACRKFCEELVHELKGDFAQDPTQKDDPPTNRPRP